MLENAIVREPWRGEGQERGGAHGEVKELFTQLYRLLTPLRLEYEANVILHLFTLNEEIQT